MSAPLAPRLADRTALVFGAGSSGPGWSNGKAAALTYARAGARVVSIDIAIEAAEETAGLIIAEGGEAIALQADVTDAPGIARVVEAALKHYGTLDILHNNVGLVVKGGPLEVSEAAFQRALDVNLGSVYRTVKAVLPHFIAQKRGVIINIASLAAIRWTGYSYFAYAAAKAAVVQATQAFALEYAPLGIRANVILPGMIDTPLIYKDMASHYASPEAMRAARDAAVPMGHMGTAFDVAEAALFLASDAARFITGVALLVDGGQSCAMPH